VNSQSQRQRSTHSPLLAFPGDRHGLPGGGGQAAVPLGVVQTFDCVAAGRRLVHGGRWFRRRHLHGRRRLDTAVSNTTVAASVATALGSSATVPPSQNAIARWNTAGRYSKRADGQ